MIFTTEKFFGVAVESWPGIGSHNHRIPFRCSNQLSYLAMSSTCTQSQHCKATPSYHMSVYIYIHINVSNKP